MNPGQRLTLRLGLAQIIGWGSGFYLPAILAVPISETLGIETQTFFWAFTISLLVSGLVGPRVGRAIDRLGGRRVLPFGNLFFAAGLALLAFAQDPVTLFLAWGLIGVGASMGNYDAAFATAVTFFGDKSNRVIAGITVFAGFSSTIAWPITAVLSDTFDWRVAVLFWAAAQLLIALPLHATIPRVEPREVPVVTGPIRKIIKNRFRMDLLLVIFAVMFALEGFIVSSVNTTLPFLLGELGADSALALLAATILGPSQVLARILLVALGKVMTPMRVAALSIAAHPIGVILLLVFGVQAVLPFVVLHGIGVGLNPFIRGSLPLLFFGSESFGQRQGYIMMLSKIVSALSPTLLTLLVLKDPMAGLVSTMTMGLVAAALLVWLSFIHKVRKAALADASAASSLEG
ncbi:MAG: MFS transporter [Aquiluna sp.]|nr:MFS transporter [Aquiluna sp.]MCF8545808.1 MFS transporter [Aquiluna sp.]